MSEPLWVTCRLLIMLAFLAVVGAAGCENAPPPKAAASHRSSGNDPSQIEQRTVSAASPPIVAFREVTEASGVHFIYRNDEEAERYTILESLGGGAGIFDFDRDGLEDIGFPGGGEFSGPKELRGLSFGLFRNRGAWKFVPATENADVGHALRYNHGVAAADYDSDGFPDFAVTGYGGLQLFHNDGDGTFEDVTLETALADPLWSSSAAWGDLNGDGCLDLFAAHYVDWSFENDPDCSFNDRHEVCPPRRFGGLPSTLFLSDGQGAFTSTQLRKDDKALGVLAADLDLDGDLDIYVTNDATTNDLYRNDGKAQFEDVSLVSGTSLSDRGTPDGSMGVDLCDFNHDGLPDLWVVNYESETHALYQNEGDMFFRHVSQSAGISAIGGMFVGWGTNCVDLDRDGDEDIFVSNGHVIRHPTNAPLMQLPVILESVEGGRFRAAAAPSTGYFSEQHMGRGSAAGDLDQDGDVDLVISRINAPVAILSNETTRKGAWIGFDLIGTASPRDPIGSVLTVKTSSGKQTRHRKGGGSFASSNSRIVDFGLGDAASVESVEIRWPSGQVQHLADLKLNSVNQVVEPAAEQ
jgi:hypothetical protein